MSTPSTSMTPSKSTSPPEDLAILPLEPAIQMTGGYPPSGSRVPEADDIKRKIEKVCLEGGKNPHFPSIGSDEPPPPPSRCKKCENSGKFWKNQGTSGGPLGTRYNRFRGLKIWIFLNFRIFETWGGKGGVSTNPLLRNFPDRSQKLKG